MAAAAEFTIQYVGAAWCGPCKTVKPRVEELAQRFSVPLDIIDYDMIDDEAEKTAVSKLPTVRILMANVMKVEFITRHVEQLESWLKSNVRVNTDADF